MLDIKAQSQFSDATAEMMRACALATARAASTPARFGMNLWSQMLRLSAEQPTWYAAAWTTTPPPGGTRLPPFSWNPLDGWAAWSRACAPLLYTPRREQDALPIAPPAADPAFSSYRSSGGHAVAQVILP